MVINDLHQFVFVHVPKTGGSSMASALRTLDGNNTNLIAQRTKHQTLSQLVDSQDAVSTTGNGLVVDSSRFSTFGFVRNPWIRIYSLYRYLVEHRPRPEIDSVESFKNFLELAEQGEPWIHALHSLRPQSESFCITTDADPHADFIGHFEFLNEDFKKVSDKFGLPNLSLPHTNRSSASNSDHREFYDIASIEVVGKLFERDVTMFGYVFEQAEPARRCSGPLGVLKG